MRAVKVLGFVIGRASCVLCAGVTLAMPAIAIAQPSPAKDAYDRGSEAFARKGYAEAAASFALADKLEPNPVALEAALKAVVLADDPVLGMELVERAGERPPNAKVATYVKQARAAFEKRAGKLSVSCADERGCTVKLNGVVLELGKRHWVRAGVQNLEVTVAGAATTHHVEVGPGAVVDFTAPAAPKPALVEPSPQKSVAPTVPGPSRPAPAPVTPPPAEPSRGIHPAVFGITAGLFAVAGGITIWSGVDALDKNSRYLDGDDSARDPGMLAQDRTNALIGVTIGGAVATTLVAIFTNWGTKSSAQTPAARAWQGRYQW